jgi:hypothetical protein
LAKNHFLLNPPRSSFAYGVPCSIVKDQYDVSLPDRATLLKRSSQRNGRGTDCFLALCTLTEILADVLPFVFSLNAKSAKESSRNLRRLQTQLDEWEEALPEWIRIDQDQVSDSQDGSCSLQLSFLAVKMLLCRIALRVN